MPDFIDIEQITLRGGPDAYKFGDEYTWSAQGKVEHDRYIYISGMSGSYLRPLPVITKLKEMGRLWKWNGIRWERLREDGSMKVIEIKI